jgi:hypothetical protein
MYLSPEYARRRRRQREWEKAREDRRQAAIQRLKNREWALQRRFWAKVKKVPGGCWVWQSAAIRGYGVFEIGTTTFRAHHVAWALTHGPLAKGARLYHRCTNTFCVRPDHLSDRRVTKDRWLGVPRQKYARVTEEERIAILRYFTQKPFESIRAVAQLFGVSRKAVKKIFERESVPK